MNNEPPSRSWEMWAHDKGGYFEHMGCKRFVEAHYMSYPIVPVTVTEDPSGDYWGWLDRDSQVPTMMWGHEGQYRMCFSPSSEQLEKEGRGRTLKLTIAIRAL